MVMIELIERVATLVVTMKIVKTPLGIIEQVVLLVGVMLI